MGRTIIHAGPSGSGQTAKICNNMMLAASMIAVCEGFALAEKLGPRRRRRCSTSAATRPSQCWAMTSYCPVPGPVPAAPSNRGYAAGFTAANMLKDLRLAQQAAGADRRRPRRSARRPPISISFMSMPAAGRCDFSGDHAVHAPPRTRINENRNLTQTTVNVTRQLDQRRPSRGVR